LSAVEKDDTFKLHTNSRQRKTKTNGPNFKSLQHNKKDGENSLE